MREIKFRGKDDNGNWHFGDLCQSKHFPPQIVEDGLYTRFFCVDPDTVGQFTGLVDSAGKEIYEGDIIKRTFWRSCGNFVVTWGTDGWFLDGAPLYSWFDLHTLEVVGNVHDNLGLLNENHPAN